MTGPHAIRGLVVTLGPASLRLAAELAAAGATALRLNGSHLGLEALREALASVRAAAPDCPIWLDLQGAKLRLGRFAARPVHAGEAVRFARRPDGPDEIPLPHAELFRAARVGHTLSIDDGRALLDVVSCTEERLTARARRDARLAPRKGVHVVEAPVEPEGPSELDRRQVELAVAHAGVGFCLSFTRDGREADVLRRLAPGRPFVGKIERQEAIADLAAIAARTDALWICRGDLGAQLGVGPMARWVAGFEPATLPKPVWMAGQVLEHLAAHPDPTRSEVCHLFDLLDRGYAGVVLSDETATGHDPVHATRCAAELLRAWSAP